jgi:hypothetical protein
MKSMRDVERRYREAVLCTNPAQDQVVVTDALRAGGLARGRPVIRAEPSLWKTITKNRTAKLVTAAGIVAVMVVSISYFKGTVVKAVEFAEMIKAMQQVSWMHETRTGLEVRRGGSDEHWAGFETRIQATKRASGNVLFVSEKDHRQWEYDPNSNTITISYLGTFPIDLPAPATMLTTMHKLLEEEGVKVVVKMGSYKGRQVQVQDLVVPNAAADNEYPILTLYVDADSKLPYGAEMKALDTAGNMVVARTSTCDYPLSGPRSIYDLGVPRDARLVDRTPGRDFQALWEEYRRHKAAVTNEYIAVIVHREKSDSEAVRTLDVEYKSGRRVRHERYFLSPRGERIAELGPQYREQLSGSLEPLRAWARRRYEDPGTLLSIHLYDGQYYNSIDRDNQSGWGKLNRAYSPNDDEIGLSQTVAFQAWPTIPSTARIIEDDYARQNGFLCVENLTQGQVLPGGGVGHPGRLLYYLDPARDYLCRRQVMEWCPNAEWQQDKTRLKSVDPKRVGTGGMVVWEITEVYQAPNGHWYPRAIVQKQTDAREDYRSAPWNIYDVETIYLDLSPAFPEGIFDPEKLPGR